MLAVRQPIWTDEFRRSFLFADPPKDGFAVANLCLPRRSLRRRRDLWLVQFSAPTSELKYDQEISVVHAGSKFPIEQCHHRTRVQFAVMG
jgi:hypothetical protein